jgi:hypothetical protein
MSPGPVVRETSHFDNGPCFEPRVRTSPSPVNSLVSSVGGIWRSASVSRHASLESTVLVDNSGSLGPSQVSPLVEGNSPLYSRLERQGAFVGRHSHDQ